jgi:hypothetical protein
LYIPISEDHVRSALAFSDAGMGIVQPVNPTAAQLAQAVSRLIADEARLRAMVLAGPAHIDGKGAANIAADLAQAVDAR